MTTWSPSTTKPGYMEKTMVFGAATIVVYRPTLSKEDRATRESQTRTALEGAMREYFNRRNHHEHYQPNH